MSKPAPGVSPPIVASIQSPRWTSRVQNGIESLAVSPRVHWVLDIESAKAIIVANRKAALIVECPESLPSNPRALQALLASLPAFCNNAQNSPIFLLGDQAIEPWRPVLLEAGATDVCSSILDFEKTWQKVTRHLKISTSHDLTVEQTVSARLPW